MFYVVGNNSQMYFDVKEYKPHPFPNAISGSVLTLSLVGPSAIVQNLTLPKLYYLFSNLPILEINQIGNNLNQL